MTITIPLSIEGSARECLIQLRDLADRVVVPTIFHGDCEPGIHAVEFDTDAVPGGLEAGVYMLHVVIGGEVSTYPLQYMP
jgi:hypothetical protein